MGTRPLVLAVIACLAIGGCSPEQSITVSGPKGASAETELLIYELVVRNLVADQPSGRVVHVSFGESWIDHVDPPERFFARLVDVDVALEPVSKRHESDTDAELFEVRLIEWMSESEATVTVTHFRFGVGVSDGFTAWVTWDDGVWTLSKTKDHWSI